MIDKNYMNIYMKSYIKNSPVIICQSCGVKYKSVYKYKHNKTFKHNLIKKFNNEFENIKFKDLFG